MPRLKDLEPHELAALMSSVQTVGKVIERVYGADALTIACQDGKAAGQTVPHVHFHLLPRKLHGDRFATRNDEVYPAIEQAESQLPSDLVSVASGSSPSSGLQHKAAPPENVEPLHMDADEDRKPRSMEEMVQEAEWLKGFFNDVQTTDTE